MVFASMNRTKLLPFPPLKRDTEMVLPDSMARAAVGESFVKAVGDMALKHTALTVGAS